MEKMIDYANRTVKRNIRRLKILSFNLKTREIIFSFTFLKKSWLKFEKLEKLSEKSWNFD
jgi:hypothetical protein